MTRRNWSMLKGGENGRTKEEALKNAADILKKILNSALKRKLKLINNQALTKRQLEENGYKSFVSAYSRYSLKLNEIITKAGLIINLDKNKHDNLDKKSAAKKLIEIINSSLRRQLNLKENEVPTRKQLQESKFKTFATTIDNRKHLKYSDIIKEAGFNPNLERNKWANLNILTAIKYLKKILKPQLINKLHLKEGEAPSKNQLENNGKREEWDNFLLYLQIFSTNSN